MLTSQLLVFCLRQKRREALSRALQVQIPIHRISLRGFGEETDNQKIHSVRALSCLSFRHMEYLQPNERKRLALFNLDKRTLLAGSTQ